MSEPLLLSVVRAKGGVYALIGTSGENGFEVAQVPIERVRESLYPGRDRLRAAWTRLGEARGASAELLCEALVVLMETVPELPPQRPAVALDLSRWAEATPPKRTAAHPRGYRGTKPKPAKTRQDSVDLREYVCDPASLRTLGAALERFAEASRKRLAREGYAAEDIERASAELRGEERGKPVWQMPPAFVQLLWREVRPAPQLVSRYLSLYPAIGLDLDRKALEAVARLMATIGVERAVEWAEASGAVGLERRAQLLHLLADSEVGDLQPDAAMVEQLGEVSFLAGDDRFENRIDALLLVWERGESAEYLLAGIRIAAEFQPWWYFQDIGACADLPADTLDAIARAYPAQGWFALTLWQGCGKLPGMPGVLAASRWREMGDLAARDYLRLLCELADLEPRGRGLKRWVASTRVIPEIERLVLEIPAEQRERVVALISEWFDEMGAAPDEARVAHCCAMTRRLAAAPFEMGTGGRRVLWSLLGLRHAGDLARVGQAPDSSFAALEKECRSENNATLVNLGMRALVPALGRMASAAFVSAPGKLCRVAKKVGGLAAPARAAVVKECAKNSLVRIDATRAKLEQVCHVIEARRASYLTNPIPAQLSKWMRGELTLSSTRVVRYKAVMAERLILTKLDMVDHAAAERLKRQAPKASIDAREEFALMLLGTVRRNRRGLRKFLDAYWKGDRDYLARHPLTMAWYRKHPAAPREVWENGVEFTKAGYRIGVEKDPLEVLRLGEYVGSCLGLGGCNAASAVAALLDANKQVLYARDKSGKVAGRQLVAISDEDRLLCFSVYPKGSSAKMQALFRAYDIEFSKALGLPIYIGHELGEGYAVERVLSHDWYDDFAWDLTIPGEGDVEKTKHPRKGIGNRRPFS
jgi:hypothetical protein